MYLVGFLLLLVFLGSGIVWWQLIRRILQKRPLLEKVEEGRAGWRTIPELTVAYIALLCFCLAIKVAQNASVEREPLTIFLVVLQSAIPLVMTSVLILTLMISGNPLSFYGIRFSNLRQQLKVGFFGYLGTALPMAISMIATFPLRSRETEHSLLKLLEGSPDQLTVAVVVIAAVLAAPIWEELQFRVILQGWLSTLFPANVAIVLVALFFALVHGWRDGLALLPLALILGYVFHRQHSYLAVVVIHALFNATMLAMQLTYSQVS